MPVHGGPELLAHRWRMLTSPRHPHSLQDGQADSGSLITLSKTPDAHLPPTSGLVLRDAPSAVDSSFQRFVQQKWIEMHNSFETLLFSLPGVLETCRL